MVVFWAKVSFLVSNMKKKITKRKRKQQEKNPNCMEMYVFITFSLGNVVWFITILRDGFEAQENKSHFTKDLGQI